MTCLPGYYITLLPVGVRLQASPGALLRDLLFEQGVEFPCGGQGRCRGCRVRLITGDLPVTDVQRERLTPEELLHGWRLACQGCVASDLTLELRQWDAAVLTDETPMEFLPAEGLGIAVDVGTTTLVAQLLDLTDGQVLAVRTALNAQARFGADVMSRVQFAVVEQGHSMLVDSIRRQVGALIQQLLQAARRSEQELRRVVLAGNTVMHHLFCDESLEPLARHPFEPHNPGMRAFDPADLGWDLPGHVAVWFLPCIGGFVGSDVLAGVLATRLHEADRLTVFIDLGTNGEIVVGHQERMLCASTAAGPAFEGARIAQGMRAATGAIWRVSVAGDGLHCDVLGDVEPAGICGSGLVDAVAAGLQQNWILPTGRLRTGERMLLAGEVFLTQTDIRQLQLAKAAIAAGVRILLRQWGATPTDVTRVLLAGAFGNYVDRNSARRIGLLDFPAEIVVPAGNTALLGAKIFLFTPLERVEDLTGLSGRIQHISLSADPDFQEIYVQEMMFPAQPLEEINPHDPLATRSTSISGRCL
ncbi:MAG: ASKHA domain-containing protein [Chloroherpetonaceae bacterium]|nr:ASKHA domain-containing protein [Chthonomonadaceae bacterium]MDW8208211.1 ASKHA domain-containing protein [Chloroherpetonaceae bacterium]